MKTTTRLLAAGISAVALLMLGGPPSHAQTSEEFKAMKELLDKQSGQIEELLKGRLEDRQKIQRLEQLVGETQKKAEQSQQTAATARQKAEETQKTAAEAAATVRTIQSGPSEEAATKSNFQLTGYAHAGYQKTDGERGSFFLGSFNPIFLYRTGEKLLFEGELEVEVENAAGGGAQTEIGLEYGQIDYVVNDYLTAIVGKMFLPLGTFMEKTHPAWINKLPNFPLPRQDATAILPEGAMGVQLRGAFHPCGDHVLNYAVYGANGPGSMDGSGKADQLDLMGNVVNLNSAPSAGGRLGWLYPWKPSHDLELGVSGQSGTWGPSGESLWSAGVIDAALHLGPYFEARGEYIRTWQETADRGTLSPNGWWAQAAYKLAGLNLEVPALNNLEGVFRYSVVDSDQAVVRTHGYALGVVYYFTSQFQAKAAYEFVTSTQPSEARNRWLLQIAYGF